MEKFLQATIHQVEHTFNRGQMAPETQASWATVAGYSN